MVAYRPSFLLVSGLVAFFVHLNFFQAEAQWEHPDWGNHLKPGVAIPKPKPSLTRPSTIEVEQFSKWWPDRRLRGFWDDPAWGGTGGIIYPNGDNQNPSVEGRRSDPRPWPTGGPDWTRPASPDRTRPLRPGGGIYFNDNGVEGRDLPPPGRPQPKPRPRPWPYPIWREPFWQKHQPGFVPYMRSEDDVNDGGSGGGTTGKGRGGEPSGRFLFPSTSFGWKNTTGITKTQEQGGKQWFGGQNWTVESVVVSETEKTEIGEETKIYDIFGSFGKKRRRRDIPIGIVLPGNNQ